MASNFGRHRLARRHNGGNRLIGLKMFRNKTRRPIIGIFSHSILTVELIILENKLSAYRSYEVSTLTARCRKLQKRINHKNIFSALRKPHPNF